MLTERPAVPDQTHDHVGYRWKMAVQVRMGEKEILQAMKQAVVMLMLDSHGDEDDDDDVDVEEEGDNDDASPGSNANGDEDGEDRE